MRYVKEPKGDYRVQYWTPEKMNDDEKWMKGHNIYYFDDEWKARAKYVELLTRQALGTMDLEKVVFEVLFDYGGDDMLAYCRIMESTKR